MRDFDIIHSETYGFKSFDFWEEGSCVGVCYELALEKLKTLYPNKHIDSCDYFGLYVFDENDDLITQYSTGRMGIGSLAMRNDITKEVFPLFSN